MPIDFSKLNDPVFREQIRKEREEAEEKQAKKDAELQGHLNKCLDAYESLPERERSFILSCRTCISTHRQLSDAQDKWLRDISARLDG